MMMMMMVCVYVSVCAVYVCEVSENAPYILRFECFLLIAHIYMNNIKKTCKSTPNDASMNIFLFFRFTLVKIVLAIR